MRKITLIQLQDRGACQAQVDLFHATFGESASLTKANWSKALGAGLDVLWPARLLPSAAWAEYNKVCNAAWDEYSKVCSLAHAKYDEVCNAAWAEYIKVCRPAHAKYNKVRSAACAEYDRVCDPAHAKYNKVRSAALLAALRKA